MVVNQAGNQVRVRGVNTPMDTQTPPWWGQDLIPAPPGYGVFGSSVPTGLGGDIYSKYGVPDTRSNIEERYSSPGLDSFSLLPDLGGLARTAGRQSSLPGRMERSENYRQMQTQAVEEPAAMTFEEYMAGRQFDETPYRNYMNFLLSQDEETMSRINSMYRQLAKDAEDNMARVGRVYEGAEKGVGDVYASTEGVVGESYASAQQQAADQLARLGIEEAAPQVINPMALSQAEAMSNIATGRGAALGATEQFGATAQDFATQMGQVGQQQGLEVSNQILRDMAQRQAEAMFQMEQARASYNPYASALQEMEARQVFNQMQNPQTDPEMEFKAIQYFTDTTLSRQEKLISLQQDLFNEGVQNRKYTNDSAGMEQAFQDALALLQWAEATFPLQ